jgi:hypothetical protein
MNDKPFGQRYAYGLAEGAALNSLQPWSMAAAVGRDVGQFLLGSVGWAPSQARPEANENNCEHSACNIMNGKLKVNPRKPGGVFRFVAGRNGLHSAT